VDAEETRRCPARRPYGFWLSLGIVCWWVSLLSQWCHALLLAPVRHPEDVLHPLQHTYPLHAGLITAVMGFVALCATRLAYWARRAHRQDG